MSAEKQLPLQPLQPIDSPGITGLQSSRDLNHLHPRLRVWAVRIMETYANRYPNDPEIFVTQTYRGQLDQMRMLSTKRSKAPWGRSLHNAVSPEALRMGADPREALAVDFGFREGGKYLAGRADFHLYAQMGEIAKEFGFEWGGDWQGVLDGPHIQPPMASDTFDLTGHALYERARESLMEIPHPFDNSEGDSVAESATDEINKNMIIVHYKGMLVDEHMYWGDDTVLIRVDFDNRKVHVRFDKFDEGVEDAR